MRVQRTLAIFGIGVILFVLNDWLTSWAQTVGCHAPCDPGSVTDVTWRLRQYAPPVLCTVVFLLACRWLLKAKS